MWQSYLREELTHKHTHNLPEAAISSTICCLSYNENCYKVGDPILVKNQTYNKLDPPYNPERHVVINLKGYMIVASDDKKTVTRNASFMKALPLESEAKDHMQSSAR